MNAREQRNAFAYYNRQLENYAKHLGTESEQYKNLVAIGERAGFTFAEKGKHVIASAGQSELSKMNSDILESVKSVPTWGQIKEWYQGRLSEDLKGKSRKEQEEIIKEEAAHIANIKETMKALWEEVYEWQKEHETIEAEYIISVYHNNYHDAWNYTKEQFDRWVQEIHAEMATGGTKKVRDYEAMTGELYNDTYGTTPE